MSAVIRRDVPRLFIETEVVLLESGDFLSEGFHCIVHLR